MFAKCQYMDELTGGKGITFATGTPISNSMTELYTNMRYLQYNTLQKLGLGNFDSWAATFGETQTAIELAPEGTGYRAKTRFAKFFNLPELISLFKESADIQTPDMLKLPVPEAEKEYQRMLNILQITPSELVMVGNSLKSDIQPVLSLGGYGVHIPFEVMWKHEVVDSFTHVHLKQVRRFDELLSLF